MHPLPPPIFVVFLYSSSHIRFLSQYYRSFSSTDCRNGQEMGEDPEVVRVYVLEVCLTAWNRLSIPRALSSTREKRKNAERRDDIFTLTYLIWRMLVNKILTGAGDANRMSRRLPKCLRRTLFLLSRSLPSTRKRWSMACEKDTLD